MDIFRGNDSQVVGSILESVRCKCRKWVSRLSAVEVDGCQVSRPLRGLQ